MAARIGALLTSLTRAVSRLTNFTVVIAGLPLVLHVLNESSFFLFSLLLTLHQIVHSTILLTTKSTRYSSIAFPMISLLSIIIPPFLLVLVFDFHLNDTVFFDPSPVLVSTTLPSLWASFLRFSSPLFILLEGLASLLVVQACGKKTKAWIDDGQRDLRRSQDVRGFVVLIGSSTAYVSAIFALIHTFPGSTSSSPYPPFLLGVAVTTTAFLTFLGLHLRRTNIIESSLVLAYLSYSVWLIRVEGGAESLAVDLRGRAETIGKDGKLWEVLLDARSQVVPTLRGLFSTLPVTLALIYRVAVISIAARIVLFLRQSSQKWATDPLTPTPAANRETPSSNGERSRRSSVAAAELQHPSARITSFLLAYRRAILVAVYTHLLLLSHSFWWRWASISLFLAIWAAELILDEDEDDQTSADLGLGLGNLGFPSPTIASSSKEGGD